MRIQFRVIETDEDDFGPTQDELDRIIAAVPNWTWNDINCDVVVAEGWNPLELMVLDPVRGTCIVRFGRVDLVDPTVTTVRDARWMMTGEEIVLVGRFGFDGFEALPPD